MDGTGTRRKWTGWTVPAMMALLSAAACLAGCQAPPERVEVPRRPLAVRRSVNFWIDALRDNDLAWATLQARCEVRISNPQINTPTNSVTLGSGLLVVKKPDLVYLRIPHKGTLKVRLAGNGELYRAELPALSDSFDGRYGDPVEPQPGRIHIMPADIVHAFSPASLLGRAPVLHDVEQISRVSLFEWESDPPAVRIPAAISFDRISEAITTIEKYNADGAIRSVVTYPRRELVETGVGRSVQVPTAILIDYPMERTRVLLRLEAVKLDQLLDEESPFKDATEAP